MMVVNAALFQDIPAAATAAGAKGGGGTDPQGGGFAKILSGHAGRDAASQADAQGASAQSGKSSATAPPERYRWNHAGKAGDQVEQGAEESEQTPGSLEELIADAEAQRPAADAAAAAVAAGKGNAEQGSAPVVANGNAAGAAGNEGNLQLPQDNSLASSPTVATTAATLPIGQVVAQDQAQLQGESSPVAGESKSHAPHHGKKKAGEGEAVSSGAIAPDGKEQAGQGAPATLAAMLSAGAAMVTAGRADVAVVNADAEEPVAGIAAPAATAIGGGQSAPTGAAENGTGEALPQVAARGEQSAQLEALQQQALKLAAAQHEAAVQRQPVPQGPQPKQGAEPAARQMVQSSTQQASAQVISTSAAAIPQQSAPAETQGRPQGFVATPVASSAQAVTKTVTATGGGTEVKQEEGEEQKATRNVSEVSPQQTQNTGNKAAVITSTYAAKAQTAQPENAGSEEAVRQDASAVAADRKEPRQAEAGRHASNGEKIAAEPAAANQKTATSEISGTKTAVTAASTRLAAQGSPGQNGSGDAGEKGHQEQKAQNLAPQTEPATAGMMQFSAARELSQPAAASSPQSALHENILSQVKDAVVTHDGKGNGEVSIRLNPGELGELKIQVRMDDNRVRVEVQADNKMVKDLLLSNLDSLKEALSGKNFTMDGFDVSTGAGGGFNSPLPEQRGGAQQQAMARSARPAAYSAPEESQVNYMTAEVNNLLDVRF
jgi:flagellar hook-length control protein FliK